MNDNFGSLGDLFPETEIRCRIHGCGKVIHISGERALHNVAQGREARPNLMCPECLALFNQCEDKQVPCSKPGCDGTWTWNRIQQVEAKVQGRGDNPPAGYCQKCRQEMKATEEKQIPCRIRNCKNTWTWTARMQMESRDGKPPHRLCNDCFQLMNTLQDKELPCRVRGCQNKVHWNRTQQLEHLRSGRSLEKPPQWMCEDCLKASKSLEPQEVKCKIHGCSGTWTYTPLEQLEALKACKEGETPAVPSRMCKACFDFFQTAKDIVQPCRNHGCHNTWVWTRSMQLGSFAHGREVDHAPARMCEECQKKLAEFQEIQLPCQEQENGCEGTWTYRPEDQLRDQLAGRQAPRRHCPACSEFLKQAKPEALVCAKCGKSFTWSVQEQLQHHLGNFAKPENCAECVSQEIQGIGQAPAEVEKPEEKPEA